MTRRAMTLVEMLVATTATLILMAAVAQIFSVFGNAVTGSRAMLALDAQMRTVAWRLRMDLAGATARTLPPLSAASGEGYFEIIEGPATDSSDAVGVAMTGALVSGDHDDALLFTTRSIDAPFMGKAPGTTVFNANMFESTFAEVAWFARPDATTTTLQTYTLYRRQLLVMGYVGVAPFDSGPGSGNALPTTVSGTTWSAYYALPCDVSARLEVSSTGFLRPNTLADLTRREARFLHNPWGLTGPATLNPTNINPFPFVFAGGNHQASPPPDGLIFDPAGPRAAEDVVLTNVLAFDVRVFDPTAPLDLTGSTALVPGDPGYTTNSGATGAYVDLGINTGFTTSRFSVPALTVTSSGTSPSGSAVLPRTYDTWSLHYENNGLDEDGAMTGPDQAFDGLDNGGLPGVIDDPGEFETRPPYPYPLRGIEVRIRCYEPTSRQVRQVTVRHTFVPH